MTEKKDYHARSRNKFAPTPAERAALTRIYGDEENWLGVATQRTKKNRAKMIAQMRKDANVSG